MNYISPLKSLVTLLLVGSAISLSPPTNASILKQGFNLLRGLDTSEPDRRARDFCEKGRSEFGWPKNAKTDSEYQYIVKRCLEKYQPEFRAGYRKTLDSPVMKKFEYARKKCRKLREQIDKRESEGQSQYYYGWSSRGLKEWIQTPLYIKWEKCRTDLAKKYPKIFFYEQIGYERPR